MSKKKWWSEGVRFECQGSGRCCLSRGEYGHVYLTSKDRRALAKLLKLSTREFTKTYCELDDGSYQLKEDTGREDCIFLEGKRCGVYEARPTQCRTWPFWPEHMGAKQWAREVAAFCPGVGKGPVIAPERIQTILDEQLKANEQI